jgi:hypothetical protein
MALNLQRHVAMAGTPIHALLEEDSATLRPFCGASTGLPYESTRNLNNIIAQIIGVPGYRLSIPARKRS